MPQYTVTFAVPRDGTSIAENNKERANEISTLVEKSGLSDQFKLVRLGKALPCATVECSPEVAALIDTAPPVRYVGAIAPFVGYRKS